MVTPITHSNNEKRKAAKGAAFPGSGLPSSSASSTGDRSRSKRELRMSCIRLFLLVKNVCLDSGAEDDINGAAVKSSGHHTTSKDTIDQRDTETSVMTLCQRGFNFQSNLTRHMQVHEEGNV